ncbi:Fic family protein [Nitrosopumilus sp.]|uniref:Fic family protein n=1 Tax=Nitrosopumilus sp. TaxID=2024843 RepID=UPI00292F1E70|nr:Fic family protein [Nitrosopumilus sp.]
MSISDGLLSTDDVIIVNQQFCKQLDEPYGLDYPEQLEKIVDEINSYNQLSDDKEKAILKTTCLLVGLVFEQPFKNGNKRTAAALSILIIRSHNCDIKDYKNEIQQKRFYELLEKSMLTMEGDPTIKSDIEKFLRENVIKVC